MAGHRRALVAVVALLGQAGSRRHRSGVCSAALYAQDDPCTGQLLAETPVRLKPLGRSATWSFMEEEAIIQAIRRAQLRADHQAKLRARLALPRFKNGLMEVDSLPEYRAAKAAERAALAALNAFD
jgi:hypothetical protein